MKHFPESEFIINADGSVFHLHLQPEQLRDKIILVGDPGRVDLVASFFEALEGIILLVWVIIIFTGIFR